MPKVTTKNAIVAGHPVGSTIEVTQANADYLVRAGYADLLEEKPAKQESAPKAESSTSKDVDKDAKPKAPRKRASKDDK